MNSRSVISVKDALYAALVTFIFQAEQCMLDVYLIMNPCNSPYSVRPGPETPRPSGWLDPGGAPVALKPEAMLVSVLYGAGQLS